MHIWTKDSAKAGEHSLVVNSAMFPVKKRVNLLTFPEEVNGLIFTAAKNVVPATTSLTIFIMLNSGKG